MIRSRWHHPFDFQFSTQEFYASVEEILNSKQIKGIEIGRKDFSEGGAFSYMREYMRITYQEQMFLICAAPFGANGFFVSWWNGEWMNFFKDLIPRIPGIGTALARALFSKTYYQMDSEDMFSGTVRQAVNEAIDKLTNAQGVRPLSELERIPQYTSDSFQRKKM
jgi:hypothetical protein